jgi:transcriptional regulator with XRE-family HTH domain
MKDRIRLLMESENMTPSQFADYLGINRAVISHILNGRNNPSLEVVSKILSVMKSVNPEWLINGNGNMYKDGSEKKKIQNERTLFSDNEIKSDQTSSKSEYPKEKVVDEINIPTQLPTNKTDNIPDKHERKITQIIIYFDDNTFETFFPNHK